MPSFIASEDPLLSCCVPSNTSSSNHNQDLAFKQKQQQRRRIADKLLRIEPNLGGGNGIGCVIQTALNVHLVLLGDSLAYYNHHIHDTTHRSKYSTLNRDRTRQGLIQQRTQDGIGTDLDNNQQQQQHEDVNNDDDQSVSTSVSSLLLYYFFYDEPQTPIHPALEYETGQYVVAVDENRMDFETLDHEPTVCHSDEPIYQYLLRTSNHNEEIDDDFTTTHSKRSFPWKFILSLLLLIITGSMNILTAKFQSIPM